MMRVCLVFTILSISYGLANIPVGILTDKLVKYIYS